MTSSKPTKVGSFHSQEAVRRYINEQEGKDVFEYSVFGSPQQKIGNFTGQQKLERWSA
jgi:hypothetical protein